ncbi:uncharacterized protein LOC125036054 [Penaeus chinensis]|uniref:uncharacterized protein LOC125036054 n=1 Tax=Penaeus chinensis TaxID=139456 RepID=UPI001FB8259B|nr:uncharacterized protein LOC125036054 [Penaeus chinensis]
MSCLLRCIESPTWKGTLKLLIILIAISLLYPTIVDHIQERSMTTHSIQDQSSHPEVQTVIVEKEISCPIPALQNYSQFYEAVTTIEMGCNKTKMFGRSSSRRKYLSRPKIQHKQLQLPRLLLRHQLRLFLRRQFGKIWVSGIRVRPNDEQEGLPAVVQGSFHRDWDLELSRKEGCGYGQALGQQEGRPIREPGESCWDGG